MDKTNVTPLPVKSVKDIPGRLREIADEVESGRHQHMTGCVLVLADPTGDDLHVVGAGDVRSRDRMVGLIQTAATLVAIKGMD